MESMVEVAARAVESQMCRPPSRRRHGRSITRLKALYYYVAKKLGRQSTATAAGQVPYIAYVNTVPLLFSESTSPELVRVRTAGGEHMGVRMMFAPMPIAGENVYDDGEREMFEIIHDGSGGGGGYEDGQVEDSDPTQSGNYTHTQQGYTKTDTLSYT